MGKLSILSLGFICLLALTPVQAQNLPADLKAGIDTVYVTIEMKNEPLSGLFQKINNQTRIRFAFNEDHVRPYQNITLSNAKRTIRQTLDLVFAQTQLKYFVSDNIIGVTLKAEPENQKKSEKGVVNGTVRDSKGEPLPGVTVMIKGTSVGTTTDAEGKYSIHVETKNPASPSDATLVFTFIGTKAVEQNVDNRSIIDVVMQDDVNKLDEVVVYAGYYDVKQTLSTASIGSVKADIIEKQPITNPIATLAGRIPGVFVQQTTGVPGGAFKIQIRGTNSLRMDGNEPLYIVDGVPFSTQSVSSQGVTNGTFNGGVTSPLTGINPADIESIEVLKDADATAIYGSRGANGVVLITTKRGKAGRVKLSMDAWTGVAEVRTIDMLNTNQYLAYRKKAYATDGLIPSADPLDDGSGERGYRIYAPDVKVYDSTKYTDWQKVFFANRPITTSIQASLSGGTETTQFIFSLGYRKEGSPYIDDFGEFNYQKGSMHLGATYQSPDKKFSLNASFSGTLDHNFQPSNEPIANTAATPPNNPGLYNPDGSWNWDPVAWPNGSPLALFAHTFESNANTTVVSTDIGYEVLPGLKVKTRAGFTSLQSKEYSLMPSTVFNPADNKTSADAITRASDGVNQSWIIEPQLGYDITVSKAKISTLIGGTFQGLRYTLNTMQYTGFPSDAMLHDLDAASFAQSVDYVSTRYKYAAAFGRINVNWNDKYLLNLTGRRDGSSRFGPGKRFSNFGAVGAAWIFTNENFIKALSGVEGWLSFGKLRTSYGVTGSDNVNDYSYLDTYSSSGNVYDGVGGLAPTRLFNPDYAWEANKKLEAAIELGFLNDRIYFTAAWFRNISTNQLANYTLPMTAGLQGVVMNLPAKIENTGFEFEISTENIRSANFTWRSSFNFTRPRNELVSFPDFESSTYANTYVIGQPLTVQRKYHYTGVDPETGLYTFKDYDGDGKVTYEQDQGVFVFVGQEWFGGFNNSIKWKGFTLDIFFQYVKQQGQDNSKLIIPGLRGNAPEFILDADIWELPGDRAEYQKMSGVGSQQVTDAYYLYGYSDGIITDASFIRLKNLSVGYTFSEKVMKRVNLKVYLQGQNLITFTRYGSFDPESQYIGLAPLGVYTAGMQVTF